MGFARTVTVHIADDGVSVTFTAADGREATINVAELAEQLGGKERAVLLALCEDQNKPLLAQDFED